ncbi:EAL domain-containing protein [Paraburkholderia sp. SARCC-3016]|uniref:putative bifunctional diguanylate cyclase/phosphodiesterase n=1 Tax=Paraburkholderia sp. SARCC-3016 TaxID=3058611 RepID=UPI002807A0EE|nr:EAL domain-containing protein [Paraburkholderia sp. SARCC-3016]MDQ7981720.1 EAL domain-containing protein [Paraburkholderia sp. SARCC-3016]
MNECAKNQVSSSAVDTVNIVGGVHAAPTVLLVDDEPGILSSLKRLLRNSRYEVLTAQSGEEGLEILASHAVDLIVSDMRMPQMNGADFLARAQALYPETMRILLTGYSEIDAVVKAVNEGGVYRYLNKPWDDQDLVMTVAQALEQRRLRKETARLTELTLMQNEELRRFNADLEGQVAARTEEANRLARHDPLTGLYNRRVFAGELDEAIARAKSGAGVYLVLVIDLDRFKPVNDLRGHAAGDVVLCEVARRLTDAIRKSDTVARLGGDEFAIVAAADTHAHADGAMLLAARLLGAIRQPINVEGSMIEIGASIGIARCPADGLDAETLLRAADIAMYRAKREARGTFRFFEQSMDEELRAQVQLEIDLKEAIVRREIRPHYQPLIDMQDRRLFGFEILARWNHPTRGSVPPDTFIPVAEQLGLIPELTASILGQACRDATQWANDEIRLSLNIAPGQLKDLGLPEQILSILHEEGFPASRLEIEITETALVGDIETARIVLNALKDAGIRVALDDFGTGYSSLYHLRELRFDKVKIDKSFVQSMQSNTESDRIVDAILGLAHSLGMPTVAEGIEDQTALERLVDKGCEYGQGFHFGRAMSAESVRTLLQDALSGFARLDQ